MTVDTMRRIDHHVGILLCAILHAWFRIWHCFRPVRTARPERLLFIELSEMGSAILVDPAMRLAKAKGAEIYFLIFARNAPSLSLLQTVDRERIFTLRGDSIVSLAVDVLRFLAWARRERIDTVIDLELFSRITALLTALSGARNRVGFDAFHNEGLYRGNLLTHRVAYNPHHHIAKNFLAMVHAAFSETPQLPYYKQAIADEETQLAQAPQNPEAIANVRRIVAELCPGYEPGRHRLVLVNPNASDLLPQRRWLPQRFVEVMRELTARYPDVKVLITGSPSEVPEAENLRAQVGHPNCQSLAGKFRLEEMVALYQCSALMLTNDSGPGHFSAVTPLRTIVLFGPETPSLYGSLGNSVPVWAGLACSPCVSAANHRKTPCRDNVCLQAITTDRVLALIHAELAN